MRMEKSDEQLHPLVRSSNYVWEIHKMRPRRDGTWPCFWECVIITIFHVEVDGLYGRRRTLSSMSNIALHFFMYISDVMPY